MENFKSTFLFILIFAVLILFGYWAVSSIEPGNVHSERQKQEELIQENEKLSEEIEGLKDEIAALKADMPVETPTEEPPAEEPKAAAYKCQSLISELEKLVADNIIMKEKSRGTRVGTIQNFLNIYNNTAKRVDNDYGAGTKKDVANFQKAVGLSQTGEIGPNTYNKMIEWLKKQS